MSENSQPGFLLRVAEFYGLQVRSKLAKPLVKSFEVVPHYDYHERSVVKKTEDHHVQQQGIQMTTAEKLYKTAKELPEPVVAEILDFAEFLQKKIAGERASGKEMLIDIAGGLESSATFSGDPSEIQKRLRDEWQ
jgi:hypothetical protein